MERIQQSGALMLCVIAFALVVGIAFGMLRVRSSLPGAGLVELLLRAIPVVVSVILVQIFWLFVVRGTVVGLWPASLALGLPLAAWCSHVVASAYSARVARPFVRIVGICLQLVGPAAVGASMFVERAFAVPGMYGESRYGSISVTEYVAILAVIMTVVALAGALVRRAGGSYDRSESTITAVTTRGFGGLAGLGAVVMVVLVGFALIAPAVSHWDPNAIDNVNWRGNPVAPGVGGHLFGSDANGRDLLVRAAVGLRNSLTVAIGAAAIASVAGLLLALLVSRRLLAWSTSIGIGLWGFTAFPFVMLAVIALRAFGAVADTLLFGAALVPAAVFALHSARTITARVGVFFGLSVAALTLNVLFSSDGGGIQPPNPDLGNLLINASSNVTNGPWVLIVPIAFIVASLFALNAMSDAWLDGGDIAGR